MYHFKNVSLADLVEIIDGIEYKEEWRPVSRFVGLYEVSSFGRIKRLSAPYKDKRNANRIKPDRIMRPSAGNKKKYLKISLRREAKPVSFSIHRLVALHFIPLIEGKPHVNHKTGHKYKNHFSQLEWCTPQENNEHGVQLGLLKRGRNIKPYIKKGRQEGVKKIINIQTNEIFNHAKEMSIKTGMSIKTIRRIMTGVRYNNTPYRYLGEEHLIRIKPKRVKIIPFVPYAFGVVMTKAALRKPTNPKAGWKTVYQYSLTGELIATHESISQATLAVNSRDQKGLRKLLNGRRGKTFKGFIWKYAS
jgi:hypothetical protein